MRKVVLLATIALFITGSATLDVSLASPPVPSDCRVFGDVSGDGRVTPVDALLVLQREARSVSTLPCLMLGYVNGDGVVNAVDAAIILQYDAGLIDSLPP